MYNNKGESKMDKTILVVEVIKYKSLPTNYSIKKIADTLDKASEYLVALKNLNEDTDVEFQLFNRLGQFDVERIEKVESEETDEIRF